MTFALELQMCTWLAISRPHHNLRCFCRTDSIKKNLSFVYKTVMFYWRANFGEYLVALHLTLATKSLAEFAIFLE